MDDPRQMNLPFGNSVDLPAYEYLSVEQRAQMYVARIEVLRQKLKEIEALAKGFPEDHRDAAVRLAKIEIRAWLALTQDGVVM